jgi:hypothetical protein
MSQVAFGIRHRAHARAAGEPPLGLEQVAVDVTDQVTHVQYRVPT